MKIELGKTKIKGFKFKHLTEGVVWDKQLEKYIDKEGVIMSIHHEHIYQLMLVKFEDGNSYAYPLGMAKQYIVKEYVIPNFLIGGYETKQQKLIKKLSEGIKEILTKINNKNNMKNLKITAPEGYEIDKTNSTFENIVFKPIKKELPKSWEELGKISGGFQAIAGGVLGIGQVKTLENNKNVYATKEQAEASLALAQLSQLREVYRDGWVAEWGKDKHVIRFMNKRIEACKLSSTDCFLSFQSEEVRDLFLKNFRDLIEQAKPLML